MKNFGFESLDVREMMAANVLPMPVEPEAMEGKNVFIFVRKGGTELPAVQYVGSANGGVWKTL